VDGQHALQPVVIEDVAHLIGGSLEGEPRNCVAATDALEPRAHVVGSAPGLSNGHVRS
jgi:hypothetical protein